MVTVNPVNDDPTLSSQVNRTVNEDTSTSNHGFTIGDIESSTAELTVTATSSNPTLLPQANILLGGGIEDGEGLVPVALVPEGHRPEAQAGHRHSRPTEHDVLHGQLLLWCGERHRH